MWCIDTFPCPRGSQAKLDGTKCDVFSFAILALFVATGRTPYLGLSNDQIMVKVLVQNGRTAVPDAFAGDVPRDEVSTGTHTRARTRKPIYILYILCVNYPNR